jgi:hypothetical protein
MCLGIQSTMRTRRNLGYGIPFALSGNIEVRVDWPRYFGPNSRGSYWQNLEPREGRFAVKQTRFTVERTVAVSKHAEAGVAIGELIRRIGISEQTFYR